jgi:hypothetical protein
MTSTKMMLLGILIMVSGLALDSATSYLLTISICSDHAIRARIGTTSRLSGRRPTHHQRALAGDAGDAAARSGRPAAHRRPLPRSGMPVARVSGALAMVELNGLALVVGPKTYALAR